MGTLSEPVQLVEPSAFRWKEALPTKGAGGATVAVLKALLKMKAEAGPFVEIERLIEIRPRFSEALALK
jgi:hypothetical protein